LKTRSCVPVIIILLVARVSMAAPPAAATGKPRPPAEARVQQAKVEAQLCLAEARDFLDRAHYVAAVDRCNRVAALASLFPDDKLLQDAARRGAVLKAIAIKQARSVQPRPVALAAANAQPVAPSGESQRQMLLDQVAADSIPQVELLRKPDYPTSIPQAANPNQQSSQALKRLMPWEQRIQEALKQRVQVKFRETPFDQVVDFLREASGVNMVLDPDVLPGAKPLTLKMANPIRIGSALDWIMEITGLQYRIRDEAIFISFPESLRHDPVMRPYDISDLLFNVGDLPVVQLTERRGKFEVNDPADPQAASKSSTDAIGHAWAEWIANTVAPDSWRSETGGRSANTIDYRAGKLVVTNTPAVHKKIAELLSRFRDSRAAMVSIQARFIDINQNYLERIGFDWTGLQDPSAQVAVADTSATGVIPPSPGVPFSHLSGGFASEPDILYDPLHPDIHPGIPVDAATFVTHRPVTAAVENLIGGLASKGGLTGTGGLFLRFSMLKNHQLSGLLDAVRKEGQGTVLTAPRITCYNTQRANITVANLISYVQGVTADETPTIGTIVDGIILEVQPFVSADRRYVTIELRPSINGLKRDARGEIDEFNYQTEDGAPSTVQVPRVSRRGVNTTVSVPDGGTLMVGGFATGNSIRSKASVPFLGQLPIVNFFFKREGTSETKSNIVILLTANIIIQED